MNTRSLASLSLLLPSIAAPIYTDANGLFIAQIEHVLGTSLVLKVVATSVAVARQAEGVLLAEIDRLEAILSCYRPESEFSRWLDARLGEPIPVSDDLFTVLTQFDNWHRQTDGAISAAAEHISQLWQKAAQLGQLPAETDRQRVIAEAEQIHWQLDSSLQTATRLSKATLRLNTFAKSYILDRAANAVLQVPGVSAVVLNGGGDIVARGNWQEPVAVANPRDDAENADPLVRIAVQDRAIATSGNYRRRWQIGSDWVSHIMDPRTGLPAHDIISATVLHPNAVTAGALATAFNILTPSESALLAAQRPGTEYLLVNRDGQAITSAGWPGSTSASSKNAPAFVKTPLTTAHLLYISAKDKLWNPSQELLISFELARFEGRSHRPFVAVWIEDETGKPVRQLALWYNKPRWLRELREWSNLRTDDAESVTSATRSPGQYSLVWDGKDDGGQLVKQGKYTVMIEAAREHGSYQLIRQTMDFNGKVKQQPLNGNVEIAAAALDYREKSATR
ncbi:MAG: ApbE family lipoprotein [Spirosoma sp.]|nr:ApbE family lipoprotein [Spirosoma sp.]